MIKVDPHIPRILLVGGGTGGHVYPAIAIADAVRELAPRAVIEFAGTMQRLEWRAVPQAGYAIHPIDVRGFRRTLSGETLTFPVMLTKALVQAWSLVKAFDPDVVVGTGGYVSGPVLWAAAKQGRPVLIQEQNAYPGVTNRLLGRYAQRIFVAFEEACAYFPADRCLLTGNPVRKELQQVDREEARAYWDIPAHAKVVLVFGGSLGSLALNQIMEQVTSVLLQDPEVFLLWQTGRRYFEGVQTRVASHARLKVFPYIQQMHYAYAAADLVISRAGALTCSELMVTGTPAVLVPSPHVAADHQTRNAQAMEALGAARLLPESALESRLLEMVQSLLQAPDVLAQMARAAREHAIPDAAERIAQEVLYWARSNQDWKGAAA